MFGPFYFRLFDYFSDGVIKSLFKLSWMARIRNELIPDQISFCKIQLATKESFIIGGHLIFVFLTRIAFRGTVVNCVTP